MCRESNKKQKSSSSPYEYLRKRWGVSSLTVILLNDDVTKVYTELPAPDGDPLDVVGAELRWEGEDDVLLEAGADPGHSRVSVVVELALEGVGQDDTGPGSRRALRAHPEESVRSSSVVGEVFYQDLVLLGSEVDPA